jgi:hypothetical protein
MKVMTNAYGELAHILKLQTSLKFRKNAAKQIIEDIGVLFYMLFYFTVRVLYSSNMYKTDRNSESTRNGTELAFR